MRWNVLAVTVQSTRFGIQLDVSSAARRDAALTDLDWLDAADHVELLVEGLWSTAGAHDPSALVRADHYEAVRAALAGRTVVARGRGVSLGTAHRADAARRDAWIARLARDQRHFRFGWYSEPLGATWSAGMSMGVPVPIPMPERSARIVRGRLRALQRAVPSVAVVNSGGPFLFGPLDEEPRFLARILKPRGMGLALDLGALLRLAGQPAIARNYLEALELRRLVSVSVDADTTGVHTAQRQFLQLILQLAPGTPVTLRMANASAAAMLSMLERVRSRWSPIPMGAHG